MTSLRTTGYALFTLLTLLQPLSAAPKLIINPETFDFGEVPSGESVQATFTLRNAGDEPLHINHVRTSCGCTTSRLDKRELAPGEETPLTATLSLRNRSGPQHQRVTIASNDPDAPSRQAHIQGTAVQYLTLTPSAVLLFSAPQGQSITRTLSLHSENQTPFQLLSIEVTHPNLTVAVTPVSPSSYRLALTIPATWPAGRINESLRIHTDHPHVPILTYSITGTLQTGDNP